MNSHQHVSPRLHLREVIGGLCEAVWPLLSVAVMIAVLGMALGTGWKIDALQWPAIRDVVQRCGSKPDCHVYARMSIDYSILSVGAAVFLFLNGLSFVNSVQKINKHLYEQGVDSSLIPNFGVNIRLFALFPTFFWLIKITLLDAAAWPMTTDEWTVISIFGGCAIADLSILIVLWRQKSSAEWWANREVIGALLYIDIPTIIGVWLIAKYAPLLVKESETQEMMLRAISGGALVIHVVTSQFILCFLIAENKLGSLLRDHWKSV